jgi:single-strand DNA-binding protein
LNSVNLIGRLGKDPELRESRGGADVLNLRVAVNSRDKVDGEWTNVTDWFDVVVFGGQAKWVAEAAQKGSEVAVTGRLRVREWTSREGEKKSRVEVVADNVRVLGERRSQVVSTGGADAPF